MSINRLKAPFYLLKNGAVSILYSLRAEQELRNRLNTIPQLYYEKLAKEYWAEAEKNWNELTEK